VTEDSLELCIFLYVVILYELSTRANMGLFTKRILTVLITGSNHQKESRIVFRSRSFISMEENVTT